jgi:hypothetical protein
MPRLGVGVSGIYQEHAETAGNRPPNQRLSAAHLVEAEHGYEGEDPVGES